MWVMMKHEYANTRSMWFDSMAAMEAFLGANEFWSVAYYVSP